MFHDSTVFGTGAAKRRVPPHGDLMMQSNAAPLAEGRLLLQRKKQKESPEGSEGEDAAVLEEKPLLSHLSQTRCFRLLTLGSDQDLGSSLWSLDMLLSWSMYLQG